MPQGVRTVRCPPLKQAALCILAQEGKVLVLPVNIHEVRGEFFEKRQGDMAAVDKNRSLARARHLAQDDELVLLLDLLLRKEGTQLRVALLT